MKETRNQILSLIEVRRGFINNFKMYINESNIDEVLENLKNNTNKNFNLEIEKNINLENTIYYSEDKNMYLLESRIFNDKTDGNMINAYLGLINADMTIYEEYEDDVWSFTDWKEVA